MNTIGSKRSEKGQALVLLTVGIITLLGFAALAIDGGRVYSERRYIQGVADTSSMTGALYIAQHLDSMDSTVLPLAQASAEQRATGSGYGGSAVQVNITEDTFYYYVETIIEATVDATLGKVITQDDFGIAAKSMARVKKVNSFAFGQAFYALSPDACPAINHSGNLDVTVVGSGIYSNSTCSPSININSAAANESFTGSITAAGTVDAHQNASVSAASIVEGAQQNTMPEVPAPDCSGLPSQNDNGSTLSPGVYSGGIHLSGNGSWTLEPGLYCLDGDFQIDTGTVVGNGVLFYLRGNSRLHFNGNADITLTAPQQPEGGDLYDFNGMLIYQEYGNTGELILNGTADSYFQGTIFAPDANCQINGTGDTDALDMQVVCDTIEFIGTADLYLVYNDNTKYVPPVTIDLFE